MTNSYPAKIGRTVSFKDSTGRVRPCQVTAVTSESVATLLDADGVTSYASKSRRTVTTNPESNDEWRP